MTPRLIDRSGARFGRWTVLSHAGRSIHGKTLWLARCDCGTEREVVGQNLKNGLSSSCGCLLREKAVNSTTHGMSKSRMYQSYATMISRCHNPNFPKFASYGARGISVCDRWRNDFAVFLSDMGERPEGMTLDRIDNDGNYEPGNCRWATAREQQINRRNTVRVTHSGRTLPLAEWSRETGIDYGTLRQRLFRYGWNPARALTEEV